ncbi:MAG TPA: hypothetical protein VLM43_06865, partial [Desulfobacterales bacterium]|nr:hypothetical protein [Desulfobacterales bacterium]
MRSNLLKYILTLTSLFLFLLISCNYKIEEKIPPKAVRGILDLTDWNFKSNGVINLSGEYEFYWKQHIIPQDFDGPNPPQKTGYINVPGFWNN